MIDETVEEIRQMQTHSSSIVALKAARALRELTERDPATLETYLRDLERNSSALRRANPSHATLHTTQHRIVERVTDAAPSTVEAAKREIEAAIDRVIEQVETAKRTAAENAAATLNDGETILTHDYSTTLLEAIELAVDEGVALELYVTEACPRHLGRKTARRLGRMDGVETHLLVDGASSYVLPNCERVMLGMDCIVGDTYYNRVGTYPLCAVAGDRGVPVTVVGAASKVIDDGFVFENEFRPPSEVMREPAEGFSVENPAYDATPMRLVDEVITD
jgi:translation initiation factor eIF-2B subunit delta